MQIADDQAGRMIDHRLAIRIGHHVGAMKKLGASYL